MDKVGAIVLAAGLSRRMGEQNKLLLPINGGTMIRHVVETYLAAIDGAVCVVTGFEPDRIAAALNGLPVSLVHKADFEQGQPSSVRTGLLAAPMDDHLVIGLGDQPLLTADDLTSLIAAHMAADPAKISIPFHDTARGNPIVVPWHMRAQLLADRANPGCGKFTRMHPEHVQHLSLAQPGFFSDIDTPAAFAAFAQTTSQEVRK
jgi:molybdenum cofactor cytidylyltransferase